MCSVALNTFFNSFFVIFHGVDQEGMVIYIRNLILCLDKQLLIYGEREMIDV